MCYFQKRVIEKPASSQKSVTPAPAAPVHEGPPPDTGPYSETENDRLKQLVVQRDNEISILLIYDFLPLLSN